MDRNSQEIFEFGPFRLDMAERMLLRDGQRVALTPKVFETLVALVDHRGRLVQKDELIKLVWPDSFVEESNLTNNISTLRRALSDGEGGARYIETVPRVGYRFTAQVREVPRMVTELVVERHTLTRIETDEREEEIKNESPARSATTAVEPVVTSVTRTRRARWRLGTAAIAAVVIIIGVGAATFAIWLIAQRETGRRATDAPLIINDISRVTTLGTIKHAAISRDGRYIANVVNDAEGDSLWVRTVDAPSNIRIAGPAETEFISVTFAPDGHAVYYIALDHDKGESTLYRVPILGGSASQIANDISPISFSPDGRQIVFIRFRSSDSKVVIADADASNQRDIATRHKPDSFELEWNAPAWSPDGKKIAVPARFNDQYGHYATIIGITIADGTQAPLSSTRWNYVGQPVWLADGSGVLAPASEGPGSPTQIWHISWPDGVAKRVTHDLNNYRDLGITGDASRLVAVQVHSVSTIWVAPEADATHARQIRSEIGALEVLAWTRDGRIVYRSSAGGNGADIWIMNVDGSNARQITVGARVSRGLAVTPDDRYIIFSSDRAGQYNLWRMDIDGGNLRQLTAGDGEFYPQCTADGRWVVYQVNEVIDPRIWKVSIDGGEPVQLIRTRATKPTVSPDGQLIAYSYLDIELNPSRWGIGIVSTEGGERVQRFDFPPTVTYRQIRWSPDGQSVAFVNNVGGRSDIWLQPLSGSPPKQLTNFKADQILAFDWSRDGHTVAYVQNVELSDVVLISQSHK